VQAMAAQGSGGATASFKEDWVWDQAAATYALDPEMAATLRKNNPQARVQGFVRVSGRDREHSWAGEKVLIEHWSTRPAGVEQAARRSAQGGCVRQFNCIILMRDKILNADHAGIRRHVRHVASDPLELLGSLQGTLYSEHTRRRPSATC